MRWVLVLLFSFSLLSCGGRDWKLQNVEVLPQNASVAVLGQSVQFQALGHYSSGPYSKVSDITDQVSWQSSNQAIATVNSSGLATTIDSGQATITATMNKIEPASANLVSTAITRDLASIEILPAGGTQTVYALGQTAQFVAIGTFSASPLTEDVTAQVRWGSADTNVATINPSGLATAVSCSASNPPCTTAITATFTNLDGNTATAMPSSLAVQPNGNTPQLPTLTVYLVGQGTGTITSSPAGLSCTSGSTSGATCTGFFPLNSTVSLTAVPATGTAFGGWSSNCAPDTGNPCTVTMNNNQSVGAILN